MRISTLLLGAIIMGQAVAGAASIRIRKIVYI